MTTDANPDAEDSAAKLNWATFRGGVALSANNSGKLWKILHTQYTVTVVHRGSAEWRYRNTCIRVQPGTVYVCEPGEVHSTMRTHVPGDFTAFFCSDELIRELTESVGVAMPHFRASGVANPELWHQAASLRSLVTTNQTEHISQRMALVLQDVIASCDNRERTPESRFVGQVSRAREQLYEEFVADPTRAISVDALAATVGMSYCAFVRSFTRAYGMPPYAMLCSLRAGYAFEQILIGPSPDCTTFAALAAKCGYADHAHLTRDFRKHWGIPPSELAASINSKWQSQGRRKRPSRE